MSGPAARPLVYVAEEIHADGLALLDASGAETARGWLMAEAESAAALKRAAALIVRIFAVDAGLIAGAPDLKVISKHGVGCDNIDLAAARAAGVAVAITADANAVSVAEHTMALILAAAKRLMISDRDVREDYSRRGGAVSVDLAGRRMLIVGYGRIGRRVAPLCAAFGMEVTVWDIALEPGGEADGFRVASSLADGLAGADALTVHVPLTDATRGMIDRAALERLAPGALVVNCARGGVVDEAALAALAAAGRIGGVGSDVYAEEPIRAGNPLLKIGGAALTPHTAAMSAEALRRMSLGAAQNALDGISGALRPGMAFTE